MEVLCLWMSCLPIIVPIPHHSINPSFIKHLLLQAYAKFGAATVEIKADEFSRLGLLTNSGRNYLCMYIANRVCRTTVVLLFVSKSPPGYNKSEYKPSYSNDQLDMTIIQSNTVHALLHMETYGCHCIVVN